MSDRSKLLHRWLKELGFGEFTLQPASADASFRSYRRLRTATQSLIVMDAPPEHESCDAFIEIAGKLRAAGLNAPEVIARQLELGFLVLTDFGDRDYLGAFDDHSEADLYVDALAALRVMQTRIGADDLPLYDAALLAQEMDLFNHWFLNQLLGIKLDRNQQARWQAVKTALITNALAQPQVFVHRDYHSRNLMQLEQRNPGILDFQDAVKGPLTYDLVSLLRDCYIDWPPARVERWALDYHAMIRGDELVEVEAPQFMHWFNLMGMQRHLKAIGIFSRLKIRDGKDGYIKDIPRTLGYLREASDLEPSMSELSSLLEQWPLTQRVTAMLAGSD